MENNYTDSTANSRVHPTRGFAALIILFALALFLIPAPVSAYVFWCGEHTSKETEVWVNPNCLDDNAGSPADQIRSVLGGVQTGGMDAWAEDSGSGWKGFCYMGMTGAHQVNVGDGQNIIFWRDQPGNGALALTYCNGQSVDEGFDILIFDGDVEWKHDEYGGPDGIDIKGVITHEAGHALGLGHSQYYASTMWAYLKGNGEPHRQLDVDDRNGCRAIYGLGFPGGNCTFGIPGSYYDSCETALELEIDALVGGENIWAANDYDFGESCTGSDQPGPDVVYHLFLTAGERLELSLMPETDGFDPSLAVFQGCTELTPQCLAGMDGAGGSEAEYLQFTATESDDYYLVVDSAIASGKGSSGLFSLLAQITVVGTDTIGVALNCSPESGALPLAIGLTVDLSNRTTQERRIDARLHLNAAGGDTFSNIRTGQLNIAAGGSISRNLVLTLPAAGQLLGTNSFVLEGEDITAGNPVPAAGDRDSDSCTVVGTMD